MSALQEEKVDKPTDDAQDPDSLSWLNTICCLEGRHAPSSASSSDLGGHIGDSLQVCNVRDTLTHPIMRQVAPRLFDSDKVSKNPGSDRID
jgi:hypothetical protein